VTVPAAAPTSASPSWVPTDTTVLIVDDESNFQRILMIALDARGYRVRIAATGHDALDATFSQEPDVVLLDLGLPDMDGVEVCRQLRRWSRTPIIVLTTDGHEDRKVRALDEGADDYITKPFSMPELLARVRVAARHREALAAIVDHQYIEVGSLRIDIPGHTATLAGAELDLPRKAFALLALLARNAGSVMAYRTLVAQIWSSGGESNTQPLRTHITMLRRTLGSGPGAPRLVTEAGVGYRLLRPD
jgi:two-component system KDP operon response regulator KdpE